MWLTSAQTAQRPAERPHSPLTAKPRLPGCKKHELRAKKAVLRLNKKCVLVPFPCFQFQPEFS